MSSEKIDGDGNRYFEARAWESVDRRFSDIDDRLKGIDTKMGILADFVNVVQNRRQWYDKFWIRAGIISAILVGVGTFFLQIYLAFRGVANPIGH